MYYSEGNKELLNSKKLLSVTGSRDSSSDMLFIARKIVSLLPDYTFIQGMAKGIDAAIAFSSLSFGGTIGVLPCGLKVTHSENYSKSVQNEHLKQCILNSNSLLISEYESNQPIKIWQYLERNKIIVNLGKVLIAFPINLRAKNNNFTGTCFTINYAVEVQKPVFCIEAITSSEIKSYYGNNIHCVTGKQLIAQIKEIYES